MAIIDDPWTDVYFRLAQLEVDLAILSKRVDVLIAPAPCYEPLADEDVDRLAKEFGYTFV